MAHTLLIAAFHPLLALLALVMRGCAAGRWLSDIGLLLSNLHIAIILLITVLNTEYLESHC